jgi:uncharacterized protein YdbL (DUF1318 family)
MSLSFRIPSLIVATLAFTGVAAAALAQTGPRYGGGEILRAVETGVVGEQADGYLGFVNPPTPAQAALQRAVNENSIRRRTAYAETARGTGETIDRVSVMSALRQITRLQAGEKFRDMRGRWCAKGPDSRVEVAADDTIVISCTRN